MPKAVWNGTVIAESDKTVELEGNLYFPAQSVHQEYLKPSTRVTRCPWKGVATYYHVEVNGQRNDDAAWSYPQPSDAANQIKDHVAFWRGVKIEG